MGGKPSTPAVPDYTAAAQQQADASKQIIQAQTQANRPNQFNPTGSSTWSQDANGNWTNNVSLSPTMQGLWNQYTGNIGQQGAMAGGMLSDFGNNNANYTGIENGLLSKAQGLDAQGAQDAYMARMQPAQDIQTKALMSSLAAQGMTPGSDAYNAAVGLNNQKQNDLLNSAVLNSGTWANQQLQNLSGQYQMANALRTQPLSDYGTLMNGTQVSGNPQFSSFTNAGASQTPDLMGALNNQYTAQLGAAAGGTASNTALGSGIGTVAGGVLGSVIPGAGTMAGAGIGGALGGLMGGLF